MTPRPPIILDVHENNPEPRQIRRAADALHNGQIVLVPTETGYCFVADPTRETSVRRFLAARPGHPQRQPFSLLCGSLAQCSTVALLDTRVFRTATRAFPGPYTFVLPTCRTTPRYVVAQGKAKTVGVRVPAHTVARDLIACFGGPLLVTSITATQDLAEENYFNQHDPNLPDAWWTQVDDIVEHYSEHFDVALQNDRPVPLQASTIIDFSVDPAEIIRDSGWDLERLGIITS